MRPSDRFRKTAFLAAALFQLGPAQACAQTANAEGLFQRVSDDWALGWLAALFRGAALPQGLAGGAVHLAALTKALREALSIYSLGMLVLAGLLVMYYVAMLVAETAHHGVIMGRRVNQFWAPIRFVLAIGLLMPIGGGLNAGQYLIVKLAESGSALASNAWRTATETMQGSLSGMVAPFGPDVARLTAVATEMEICRSVYRLAFAAQQPDGALTRAGNIDDVQKILPSRLMPETWRYSNTLQANLPLCGEYRFLARNEASGNGKIDDETEGFPAELADFARADAERLMMQTRPLAERVASAFLSGNASAPDVGGSLATLMQDQQKALDAKLRTMTSGVASPVDQTMKDSASAGWLAAGFFLGNIVRRQTVFGELATYAIPSAQAPVFGHKALTAALVNESMAADPVLRNLPSSQAEKISAVYFQVANAMKLARAWLYGKQISEGATILPDTLDVRDQIGPTSDATAGAFMLTHVLNSAMAAYGVWTEPSRNNASRSVAASFVRDVANNPLAGLAEIGRRYSAFGSYVLNMTGPVLAEPSALGSALAFIAAGMFIGVAGFVLLFAVPFLPMFRFFLGVLTWLLVVAEAVMALPLVALAHLHPSGEGLSGPVARQAYWLWLGVFMRPILTLLGFVIGLILLIFALTFLNVLFVPLTHALFSAPSETFAGVRIGMSLVYAVFAVAMTNVAFKGISWLPDHALRWLGQPDVFVAAQAAPASSVMAAAAAGSLGAPPSAGTQATQTASLIAGSYAADHGGTPDAAKAAAKAHGLRSALLPAYREPPAEPVIIGAEASTTSGSTGSSTTATTTTTASGDKVSAEASAHASAVAMAKQIPLPDRPTPGDIEKALERLAKKVDKMAPPLQKKDDKLGPPKPTQEQGESREQSSAPPDDDKPA